MAGRLKKDEVNGGKNKTEGLVPVYDALEVVQVVVNAPLWLVKRRWKQTKLGQKLGGCGVLDRSHGLSCSPATAAGPQKFSLLALEISRHFLFSSGGIANELLLLAR